MTPHRRQQVESAARNRQPDLTVILENVHDPHNVSAVLRSCDAIGIQEMYLLFTDPAMHIKKVQIGKSSSAGARKWMDVYRYHDIEKCFHDVRSKYSRILGACLGEKSDSLYSLDLTEPTALILGNEHDGLSSQATALCDGHFAIPQMGFVQSLNISVACAVTLFEALRQRQKKKMYLQNPTLNSGVADIMLRHLEEKSDSGESGKLINKRY